MSSRLQNLAARIQDPDLREEMQRALEREGYGEPPPPPVMVPDDPQMVLGAVMNRTAWLYRPTSADKKAHLVESRASWPGEDGVALVEAHCGREVSLQGLTRLTVELFNVERTNVCATCVKTAVRRYLKIQIRRL